MPVITEMLNGLKHFHFTWWVPSICHFIADLSTSRTSGLLSKSFLCKKTVLEHLFYISDLFIKKKSKKIETQI